MSRMCSKPSWGDMNICYPTRVGHPGTVLEGRFFNNYCDHGQSMCSPWTPPAPASSFPVYVGDLGTDIVAMAAARGCAYYALAAEDPNGPNDGSSSSTFPSDSDGGCAPCDGLPIIRGCKFSDALCTSNDPSAIYTTYVSNSYALFSTPSGVVQCF